MKEAISSIHIANGNSNVFKHNDRSIPTTNSIFNDEVNEYNISGSQAIKKFHFLLKPRIEAYTKKTGQKLNKKTKTHLSAVLNIKRSTTMFDLRQLASYLEDKLDTSVIQIAIHRDEGHVQDGEKIKNYHAHIEMLGLDSNGYAIKQKLKISTLSTLQDAAAKILSMTRGVNYIKEKKKRPKRLNTYEFKEAKIRESKVLNNVKKKFIDELNILNNKLHNVRKDKTGLEDLLKDLLFQLQIKIERGKPYKYKQLKSFILEKLDEMNKQTKHLTEENTTFRRYLQNAKNMYLDLQQKHSGLEITYEETKQQLELALVANTSLTRKVNSLQNEQEDIDETNNFKFGL